MDTNHNRKSEPVIGQGNFQWNAGAWFGALLGSTVFLLVGAVAFIANRPVLACTWAACYAVTLTIGIVLWRSRFEMAPYPALQWLLATFFGCTTIALVSAYAVAPQLLAAINLSPAGAMLMLLLFPGLMWQFHAQEMNARRFKALQEPPPKKEHEQNQQTSDRP